MCGAVSESQSAPVLYIPEEGGDGVGLGPHPLRTGGWEVRVGICACMCAHCPLPHHAG